MKATAVVLIASAVFVVFALVPAYRAIAGTFQTINATLSAATAK